jgi:hypothetical protein
VTSPTKESRPIGAKEETVPARTATTANAEKEFFNMFLFLFYSYSESKVKLTKQAKQPAHCNLQAISEVIRILPLTIDGVFDSTYLVGYGCAHAHAHLGDR